MKLFRYSRWDGHQRAWSLDSETALDELNRYLMEGLDLEQSLDWMRQQGFELAGMDFRVMGIEELLQELRDKARELLEPFNMDHTLDGKRQQLEEILDREERALTQKEGLESERWNDFRRLRDPMPRRLSDALRSFEDHEWADAQAEADYEELLESLDDLSDLEEFYARNRPRLQGPNDLSYQQALELMRQIEALSQLARDLMEGNFQELTPDQMAQFLSDDSVQSLMILHAGLFLCRWNQSCYYRSYRFAALFGSAWRDEENFFPLGDYDDLQDARFVGHHIDCRGRDRERGTR